MNIFKRIAASRFKHMKRTPGDPILNLNCTEFEVNNWIISDFIVNHLAPIVGVHPFPLNELQLMVASVCRIRPTHIFEWGTNIGKSARIFYESSKSFNIPVEIHSVDLPDEVDHVEHPKSQRGVMVREIKEVKLYTGSGLEKTYEIYQKISGKNRVLFFVDGDHSYDSVRQELDFIIKNIPEANILIHDTFYQSEESGYNIGPYRAIVDVLESVPGTYKTISQNLGLPGMTLLWQ